MHKIGIVIGTRPEVIKMAPVYMALRESEHFEPLLISTGQHAQMLTQACSAFGLVPDIDLKLMQPNQSLGELTSRVVGAMNELLKSRPLQGILVQGDTTSVLGSSLAAFYNKVPIGHVEAGLRTYNMNSPWPEEMNRRLVAPLSRWSFAPTRRCKANLLSERIAEDSIHVTGNTVIDALLWKQKQIKERGFKLKGFIDENHISNQFASVFLSSSALGRLVLVTGHRRESFGEAFENICQALRKIVIEFPDVGIIYPVHLNPNVQEPVRRILGNHDRIQLIHPVDYETFVWLMDRSHFILTDSGGVQEEAPSLKKPVLVMRENTERPEGVESGTSRLVGCNSENIFQEARVLLQNRDEYCIRSAITNPYGDGKTSHRIMSILKESLQ